MKKLGFLFLAITSLFYACNDDFLERAPGTSINDAKYWKSPNDLRLYTNNLYGYFPRYDEYGTIGIYGLDADGGSDTQIFYNYNTGINGERVVPEKDGGWAYTDWTQLRNINYFMENYRRVVATDAEILPYAGEALFFRALFYFDKLKTFGDLPWVSTSLGVESEALVNPRDPRNAVVDSIMKDLDLAVDYLPKKGTWTGRITKETALILQARIALYEGTWEKYHAGTVFGVNGSDGTKFIQKAAETAKKLMDLGTCELDNVGVANGYTSLFNKENYSASKEIIFWKKYDVAQSQAHRWGRYSGSGAGRGITKSLIDSYLCLDGQPISISSQYKGDNTTRDLLTNRDPRLAQTIANNEDQIIFDQGPTEGFTYPTFGGANETRCVTGYQLYKGHNPSRNQYTTSQCLTSLIFYRYAEALLIYAEAKAELGIITQDDVDKTINLLRKRVGMNNGLLNLASLPNDPNKEFPNLSSIINEVRRERKVELACEGHRMMDIFRWAAADELIVGKRPLGAKKAQWTNDPNLSKTDADALKTSNYDTSSNGYIDPFKNNAALSTGYKFNINRDYLSPIPLNEIVLNPNLKQNPGWTK